MDYFLHIAILIGIYIIISVSLNLISGYTGLLSITHAALYGIGAYVAALASLRLGLGFLPGLTLSVVVVGAISVVVAAPSLRIHDDYFALASFAFQVIAFSIMNNWTSVTGGPMGLPGIPRPAILGFTLSSKGEYLALVAAFACLAFLLVRRVVNSPFGRVLKAIREDEILTQALGKNVMMYKILAFVLGGSLAAIAGGLYAHYVTYIDPTSFTLEESIFMLAIVIVGGSGSLAGSVVGAVLLISLPEVLRFVGVSGTTAANLREVVYGGLLVLCMLYRPQGLLGGIALKRRYYS